MLVTAEHPDGWLDESAAARWICPQAQKSTEI